jgi:PTH1 family peptidyl-tRNA hydrolase
MIIRLIIGLGNYGDEYINTRHNAGFWVVDEIAKLYKVSLKVEKKFYGEIAKFDYNGEDVLLLKPLTYMNLSGKSLLAVMSFYKIKPQEILVIHDELDFVCGIVKLKNGGGNGGHNGLKSIDSVIGNSYLRLRIGIDHPLDRNLVANYVLKSPTKDQREQINQAINKVLINLDYLLSYQIDKVTKLINTNSINNN